LFCRQEFFTPLNMSQNPARTLDGYIDLADWHSLRGWAFDSAAPDEPQWLEVQVDDQPPIAFLANMQRQDLADAGYGRGAFAFELRFPAALDPRQPHRIAVRRRRDMTPLRNSPALLAAAPLSSDERRAEFEAMLDAEIAAAETGPEVDRTIASLLARADRLLDARAQAASGAAALHQFRLRWNDYLEGARARPIQPDSRPWALMIAAELPDGHFQVAALRAIQALGFRVAVLSQRDMLRCGSVAEALEAAEIRVFGAPEYYSAEDVLRRNRNQFRAVILWGTLMAAGYAIAVRIHQAKARVLTVLGDVPVERVEPAMLIAAAMLNDHLLAESEEAAAQIAQRLGGKQAVRIDGEMSADELGAALAPLLPRLRINRPSDAPDPA
jgi:O-antigen biosynthesis protein